MANRFNRQFVQGLLPKIVTIYAKVNFGSTGAPTLNVKESKGVISVTRTATGEYVFTFGSTGSFNMLDVYFKLAFFSASFFTGSTTIPAAPLYGGVANGTGTIGNSTFTMQLYAAGGSAADPASGEVGNFQFIFDDSSAT